MGHHQPQEGDVATVRLKWHFARRARIPKGQWLKVLLLSPESRHDDDRPHDNDDDVTSTDASEEDDVSMRKSYLEALLQ
jgi:hypothetical protein